MSDQNLEGDACRARVGGTTAAEAGSVGGWERRSACQFAAVSMMNAGAHWMEAQQYEAAMDAGARLAVLFVGGFHPDVPRLFAADVTVGRVNRFDPHVLLQDEIWVDVRGVEHLLLHMSKHHRANVITTLTLDQDFLLRLGRGHIRQWLLSKSISQEEHHRYEVLLEMLDGYDWISRTPLVRRMLELNNHPDPDPDPGTDPGVGPVNDDGPAPSGGSPLSGQVLVAQTA